MGCSWGLDFCDLGKHRRFHQLGRGARSVEQFVSPRGECITQAGSSGIGVVDSMNEQSLDTLANVAITFAAFSGVVVRRLRLHHQPLGRHIGRA